MLYLFSKWLLRTIENPGRTSSKILMIMKKKKAADESPRNLISVAHTVRIAGKWQISLIRVPGKMLVVGVTDKGLATLAEIDDLPATESISESQATPPAQTTEQPAPNPFMDQILNLSGVRDAAAAAGVNPSDQERRAILRRLEQYKQGQAIG